jgi:purine nucleosidase
LAQEAYLKQIGEPGISLPDPVAMYIALEPMIVTQQSENYRGVELYSELSLNMTVGDRLNVDDHNRN